MRDCLYGVLLRRIGVSTWSHLTRIDQVLENNLIVSDYLLVAILVIIRFLRPPFLRLHVELFQLLVDLLSIHLVHVYLTHGVVLLLHEELVLQGCQLVLVDRRLLLGLRLDVLVELFGVFLIQEIAKLSRHVAFLHIYRAQTWTVIATFHEVLIEKHVLVIQIVALIRCHIASDWRETSLEQSKSTI